MNFAIATATALLTTTAEGTSAPPTTLASPRGVQWFVKERSIQWPKGVDEGRFLALFESIGLAIQRIAPENWEAFASLQPERLAFAPSANQGVKSEIIWQGRSVRLLISEEGRIRISPRRSVKALTDLAAHEMMDMEDTADNPVEAGIRGRFSRHPRVPGMLRV